MIDDIRKEIMYFRITIPALQDGKKDEAVSFVKDKVMPEFDGTPGLLSMTAAITGETSGINMSAYEKKHEINFLTSLDQYNKVNAFFASLVNNDYTNL